MKLSYMATCQLKTVKEFLLEGIVNSFIYLRGQGLLVDADNEKYDDKFFQMIAVGRADLRLIVWKFMQDN